MKKSILILLTLTVCSGLILLTLDRLMGNQSEKLNGFKRTALITNLQKINDYTLEKPAYSITGCKNNKLFLSNATPGEIVVMDLSTGTTKTERINIGHIEKLNGAFHTTVNYPEIFITGTNAKKIIRGNLQTGKAEIFNVNTGPVLSSVITGPDDAIIRYLDTNSLELYFAKFNFEKGITGKPVKVAPVVNNDIFSYDGWLTYDNLAHKAAYVNYYCNGITRFDNELNDLKRTTTIDKSSVPKISVAHLETAVTNSAPPQWVNKSSFMYNNTLYVLSTLKADNESAKKFRENIVIDMYDTGYKGSFYIPVPSSEILQFSIIGAKKIAVLTKTGIQIFQLS
ncbi:MAG: hypothetical protein J7497_11815 [Chitinophagaceae bacterium]|nr:hypothetical protein [Chitinophagaceae bacterium]